MITFTCAAKNAATRGRLADEIETLVEIQKYSLTNTYHQQEGLIQMVRNPHPIDLMRCIQSFEAFAPQVILHSSPVELPTSWSIAFPTVATNPLFPCIESQEQQDLEIALEYCL